MTILKNQGGKKSMDNKDIEAVKESYKTGIIYFIQQEQDVKRLKWLYEMLGYHNRQEGGNNEPRQYNE